MGSNEIEVPVQRKKWFSKAIVYGTLVLSLFAGGMTSARAQDDSLSNDLKQSVLIAKENSTARSSISREILKKVEKKVEEKGRRMTSEAYLVYQNTLETMMKNGTLNPGRPIRFNLEAVAFFVSDDLVKYANKPGDRVLLTIVISPKEVGEAFLLAFK